MCNYYNTFIFVVEEERATNLWTATCEETFGFSCPNRTSLNDEFYLQVYGVSLANKVQWLFDNLF